MKHVILAVLIALVVLFLEATVLVLFNLQDNYLAELIIAFIAYEIGRYYYSFSKKRKE